MMMRICLRYIKDKQESEDVMISGFVKIFNKISLFEYRGIGSLQGWMNRIMVNKSLKFGTELIFTNNWKTVYPPSLVLSVG